MKVGVGNVWRKALELPVWCYTLVMWACWLWMCLVLLGTPRTEVRGMSQIVDSWGAIERVALWQDAVEWLVPRFTMSQDVIAWSIRGTFAILFLLQMVVFWAARKRESARLWPWFIAPMGAHAIMWLMPPANSDIFYYSMSGSLAAEGYNPYNLNLQMFPDHPLYPFNHWIDIGSVYGPVWIWVSRTILSITGPDPVAAISGYRVFMTGVSLAFVLTTYGIARQLTTSKSIAVATAVLVAWQPNMIFEVTGQVHNDSFVMLLGLLALFLLVMAGMRALRGAIVLAAISSATKFVTLPLLGLLTLIRVREILRLSGQERLREFRALILDGIAVVAVYVAAFGLFWIGPDTVSEMVQEPSRLYSHPFWRMIEWLAIQTGDADLTQQIRSVFRAVMLVLTVVVFVWASARTIGWLKWPKVHVNESVKPQAMAGIVPLLFTLLVVELALSLVPVNAHPWYQVWSAPFVGFWAIYGMTSETKRWVNIYILVIAAFTIMYHTRIMG